MQLSNITSPVHTVPVRSVRFDSLPVGAKFVTHDIGDPIEKMREDGGTTSGEHGGSYTFAADEECFPL